MLVGFSNGFVDSFQKNGYYAISVVITTACIIEFIIAISNWSLGVYIGLSVTRAVTMIELFKLTRFWTQLRTITQSLCETLKSVTYLFILLFIVLANYALLGNQLFGNPDEATNTTSGTFNSFESSLLLTFVLLTGDNWISIMFDTFDNADDSFTKLASLLFFISFVVIGNFILMNVFLGIIVDNLTNDFEESHEEEFEKQKLKNKQKLTMKQVGILGKMFEKKHTEPNVHPFVKISPKEPLKMTALSADNTDDVSEKYVISDATIVCDDTNVRENPQNVTNMGDFVEKTIRNAAIRFNIPPSAHDSTVTISSEIQDVNPHVQKRDYSLDIDMRSRARARAFSMMLNPEISHPIPHHKALFLFPHTNSFRRKVFYVVTSSKFTYTVCLVIILSCLIMAFDDPLNRDPLLALNLAALDYTFTGT